MDNLFLFIVVSQSRSLCNTTTLFDSWVSHFPSYMKMTTDRMVEKTRAFFEMTFHNDGAETRTNVMILMLS